jgi:pimeloyl-ACP methyl ester carboxylesterase
MELLKRSGWLVGVTALVGCAGGPTRVESWTPPTCDARAVVIVIDGAGGFPNAYQALSRIVQEQGQALHVQTFEWSHGPIGFIADQTDSEYSRAAGRRLAERVLLLRQQAPGKPIELLGHSAGAAVALACAEALPPDSLERIVLLAPAVSQSYDLRPALTSARQGIDAYTSERDRFYLGFGINLLGTADGKHQPAAGRTGFCNPAPTAADAALYCRLHPHPWDPSQAWTGNNGEHGGAYKEGYLRSEILPLLMSGLR